MATDKALQKDITTVSQSTPDPAKAERNLLRLFDGMSPVHEALLQHIEAAGNLFAVSQFLANFSIANPAKLLSALEEYSSAVTKEMLSLKIRESSPSEDNTGIGEFMKFIRLFKRRYLLGITLRDISGRADIISSMDELTALAEVILSVTLNFSLNLTVRSFGEPPDTEISLIGLGKLGAEELNYSSDIDIIALYGDSEGKTSGVLSPTGVRTNRISSHEFYCKVMELLNRVLSTLTEDGIGYRVDLRLRPQGQKGELALPLKAYRTYYESWGRVWERMVLIRARPVAGSRELGNGFMEAIEPFVWRKTLDYAEIEEIRSLKKKIDSTFSRDDVKRGYGGIREAEFFVQTFQLIYGSENKSLRRYRLADTIEVLKRMGMIPEGELLVLRDNYLFLRRVEHYLQMKDDLQTHALPSSNEEMEILAKKMGFSSARDFNSALQLRRMQTKNMYNSLLGTEEDIHAEALTLLERDLSRDEMRGYLSFRKVTKPDEGLKYLEKIRLQMDTFKTLKTRTAMRRIMPELLEKSFKAESPDRVLACIESFIRLFGLGDAYLTAFVEQEWLIDGMIKLFSLSPYLSRIFFSDSRYLNTLIEESIIRKTQRMAELEARRAIERGEDSLLSISEFKITEEIRLGIFFLMGIISTGDLLRYLSHLADLVIKLNLEAVDDSASLITVMGLGKLGGREMTFGSDIDIIFLAESSDGNRTAENLVRRLTSYTDRGTLYNVDTRLRPDGSKGALIKDIAGYRDYYLNKARPWELQALLRARPVAGDAGHGREFLQMARDVIARRGAELEREDVTAVRERIMKELSHEGEGMDIKLGPGGIEEIEFYIQWLQLQNTGRFPEVAVQNTDIAVRRIAQKGIISPDNGEKIRRAYGYYRKLETFLRLNEVQAVTEGSEVTELAAVFMGHKDADDLFSRLHQLRRLVKGLVVSE